MSYGDSPHVVRGAQSQPREIFYDSDGMKILPVTLQAGYGELEAGTTLAKNLSAAGNIGKCVPYNPTTFTGAENHPGRAYLVSTVTSGSSDTVCYVTQNDSHKFAVGDDLIINSDNVTVKNCGAITAIDRTTYPHMAKITFTTPAAGTYATGNYAYATVEAGDSTNNYSDCVGILADTVDTGTGANSAGAQANLLVSNAILYEGVLTNLDSAAKTDLGSTSVGQFLIMK